MIIDFSNREQKRRENLIRLMLSRWCIPVPQQKCWENLTLYLVNRPCAPNGAEYCLYRTRRRANIASEWDIKEVI